MQRRQQFWGRWAGAVLAGAVLAGPAGAQAPPPAQAGPAVLLPPPATVPLAGPLALAVQLPGAAANAPRPAFPDIEGFRKEKLVATRTTRLLPGGQRRTELTLTQRYYPYAEGSYVIPAFDLVVGGQVLHSPAATVRVGAAPAATAPASGQPAATGQLDQLLGRPKPQYFYEPPDHAHLALEADQAAVYVGQGARVTLSLYLPPADQALLNFYNFPTQLATLRQQLRQPSAWQAPAPDPAALPDTVRQPGRPLLLRFRLAEYTYYPLTPQALRFPALALTLTKFRLLKKPQPGESDRLPMYKTYRTETLRVAVRPLPGGRAAGTAVGEYTLRETLSLPRPHTSEAFTYAFGVEGAGNPAAVVPTLRPLPAALAVYGPDIQEQSLGGGRWRKTFRYRLVARQPGPVLLSRLLYLPFFNPATARYDTLQPTLRPLVQGAPAAPAARPADDAFYGPALARADAHLQPLDVYRQVARYAAWLLAGLLAVAGIGAWRGRGG